MRFEMVFKKGPLEVGRIIGDRDVPKEDLTVGEMADDVVKTEQFLEKLTGFRVHINVVE